MHDCYRFEQRHAAGLGSLLERHGFQWLPAAEIWFIPRTRGLESSPISLADLQAQVDALPAQDSEARSKVLSFQPRDKRPVTEESAGHSGDLVFLGKDGSVSLSSLHGRGGPRFGTSAPYAVGRVGPDTIGFTDTPTMSVDMFGRPSDASALTPIARQLAMLAAEVNGLTLNMAPPGFKRGREKMIEDRNPSSESMGKRKRLMEMVFNFDITGTVKPGISLRDYVRSRHSGGLAGIGSSVKPARALTREEIASVIGK